MFFSSVFELNLLFDFDFFLFRNQFCSFRFYLRSLDSLVVSCFLLTVCCQLYLGLPLFAGTSELAQLRLICECLGPLPSHMLLAGSKTRRFFHVDGLSFSLKSDAEFFAEMGLPPRKPNRSR